ncbi:MAG TPA: nicotinamide riboside transporter PnuC [Puia sp.]|jgi:nicotinamide mononucleotide transporter|nr:nicotinamide riboside transporter PnuC [Puia sp.]
MSEIYRLFIEGMRQTTWLEFIAVCSGIASVVFSRMENILVYPVGMINTIIFVYLYLTHGLYADASVNFFYTVMSVIGWFMWAAKKNGHSKLSLSKSTATDWRSTLLFFIACWLALFILLKKFTDSTVPLADGFVSAAAAVGMWLMNKKKLENWIWWIITNLASIPLNFYKHLVFASFQYLVFLILAIMGYITWRKKIEHAAT